jgi:putative chitinase
MCIANTVGRGGKNDPADVEIVQILLNLSIRKFPGTQRAALATDGRIGVNSIEAIVAFETQVLGMAASDGLIVPCDATMKALLANVPRDAWKEKLEIALPTASMSNIELYFEPLVDRTYKYGIRSDLQLAHFIAQVGVESDGLLYAEELASGAAYEGRRDLGNTEPGDGQRFKGRGLIQITGRKNYAAYTTHSGIDYVQQPDLLATDPMIAVESACWFWNTHACGQFADQDNIREVTRRINGLPDGPNTHLDRRMAILARAKAVLGI